MPITKSAKKALRQAARRRHRNLAKKENYKNLLKQARTLLTKGGAKEAEALLPQVQKAIDKAVKTGVLKKNTASRLKSRLAKRLKKTKTAS